MKAPYRTTSRSSEVSSPARVEGKAGASAHWKSLLVSDDEVVVIRTLQEHGARLDESLLLYALNEAIRRADAEGVYWTPLLDELAILGEERDAYGELLRRLLDKAEQLAAWLREHGTGRDAEAMAEGFCSTMLLRRVAEHAPVLNPKVVERLAAHSPGLLPPLARNSALDQETGGEVVRSAVKYLLAGPERPGSEDTLLKAVLASLARRELPLSSSIISWITKVCARSDIPAAATQFPHARKTTASKWKRERILDKLANYPFVLESELLAYYATFSATPELAATVIKSLKGAPLSFYRSVARWTIPAVVHEGLASKEPARSDDEVRRHVIDRGSAKAVRALLTDATKEEFSRILRRLLESGPLEIREWLEDEGLPTHLALTPSDLAPLLEHPNHEVRLIGIAALSRIQQGKQAKQGEGREVRRARPMAPKS